MQTLGNFNSQFGRELPTERYLEAITELAKKNESYVYTCYLGLVQKVLEEVLASLSAIDTGGEMDAQVVAICEVTGLNMARMMVTDCVALDKLIRLFTTTRRIDDDNQRIFDSFDKLVVVPGPAAVSQKPGIVTNLIRYFNDARFLVSNLMKKNIVMTESISGYCLRNIKKALQSGKIITAGDACMAIRNLPPQVIYRAFSHQFGVDIGAEHVDTLDHLFQYAEANGRQVHENYWKPRGLTLEKYYVEVIAPVDGFITGLVSEPLEKMMQVVWYATHMFGHDSNIRVRFLYQVPDVHPEESGFTARNIKATLEAYDAWVAERPELHPALVGIALDGPGDDAADEGTIREFFNELHNRVYIDREDLLLVHVSMETLRHSYEDLVSINRWLDRWGAIEEPLEKLHAGVGNEILLNYGKIKRLGLNLEESKLVRFCYSGVELRIAEKDAAFAPPFISLQKESFDTLKLRKHHVLQSVVSAYLGSIFNHTNARLRLGYLTQVSDETLWLMAGSENIYVDILPGWNIRETIQNLNISPRQLTIAKELLLIENSIETKKKARKGSNDLMVIEKAVEIHTREKGGTENPRRAILTHSPIGQIVEHMPSQFVLGDGGAGPERIGIVKEYELFNELVGLPALLDENVRTYSDYILNTRFKQKDIAPPESPEVAPEVMAPLETGPEGADSSIIEMSHAAQKDDTVDADLLLTHLFDDEF